LVRLQVPSVITSEIEDKQAVADISREDNLERLFAEACRSKKPSTAGWRSVKPRAKEGVARVLPLDGVLIHRAQVKALISRELVVLNSGVRETHQQCD
jgi:hypothetical protein